MAEQELSITLDKKRIRVQYSDQQTIRLVVLITGVAALQTKLTACRYYIKPLAETRSYTGEDPS